jgi:predicted metalloprotease with PDZ domain
LPNAGLAQRFWRERPVQQLPYQRGAILAAVIDRAVYAASNGRLSLDDVMRSMVADQGEQGETSAGRLRRVLDRYGVALDPLVTTVVQAGGNVWFPDEDWGTCLTVEKLTVPVFDRGFDAEATIAADGRIIGLRPDTPAHAAGLRDGMVIQRRVTGTNGDATQLLTYEVLDGGTLRTISYLPAGRGTYSRQRLALGPGLSPEAPVLAREACLRTLSGDPQPGR